MANNQMPLPSGEGEIITQAQAYALAGVTRAVLRGCIDRGELRMADHHGSRGSARLWRSDVLRLAEEKGWPGAAAGGVVAAPAVQGEGCAECARLREARRRDADTMERLRDALMTVTAPR
jgi:hypothetical protein